MHNQSINDSLVGKKIDFDFRTGESFGTPYKKTNCQVWQGVLVEKVSINTDGKTIIHFTKDGPGFSRMWEVKGKLVDRVIKTY